MQCVSTLGFARVDVRGARTLPGCGCLQRDVSSLRNSLLFSLSNEGFKLRRPYSDELEVIVELTFIRRTHPILLNHQRTNAPYRCAAAI